MCAYKKQWAFRGLSKGKQKGTPHQKRELLQGLLQKKPGGDLCKGGREGWYTPRPLWGRGRSPYGKRKVHIRDSGILLSFQNGTQGNYLGYNQLREKKVTAGLKGKSR